jgi:3-oxoacyl-[acyl-carrier protein] reductase
MNKSMEGKVVLVVGGAGSIGAVSARRFAELGARIAISHRDVPEEAAAAAKVVESLPGEGHAALVADVSRTDTLKALRAQIEQRYGRLASSSTPPASPSPCLMPISRPWTTT